jgi:metal-dependent hydrolase (beta-lactamase superfamily II)
VGGEYGSYLITTPQGHILLDTGSTEMHDVIVSNVKKLGFKVEDIKIMISSHAHWDHVQGHAAMKKLTGAQVVALGGDAAALEAGQDNSAVGKRQPRHAERASVRHIRSPFNRPALFKECVSEVPDRYGQQFRLLFLGSKENKIDEAFGHIRG